MSKASPAPDNPMGTPQGSDLLSTKLYARPSRANLVARPRITQLLDDGLAASLILVSAPAGFGKTTVLTNWISDLGCRNYDVGPLCTASAPIQNPKSKFENPKFAWLSLDAADNDPARFWAYVILALQAIRDELGEDALAQLRSPRPPPIQPVLTNLLDEMDSFQDCGLLVLDDYHVITSTAVHSSLTFLLENLPSAMHIVISTRSDPPIPIAKLRSRGQVAEIRTDDLRFTPEEAGVFLDQTMGLALSSEQVVVLDERAEGWIAGLQMAALSLRGRDAERMESFIQAFAGTNRYIMDYLLEEVLSREPEEVQAFLLHTSVLHRLTGPLCDAVVGSRSGQEMLERLEKSNLFVVPLDDDRRWYRYHHLFADLLQARLREPGSDRVAPLLSRAAEWCEREGHIGEAVDYALDAKDYGRSADLIVRHWHAKTGEGEIETVGSWLEALPEDVVKNSAAVSVVYCWLLWLKGQVGLIEPHLVDAEHAANQQLASEKVPADTESAESMPAELAALRSFVARYHNDHEAAVAQAERALRLAPRNLPPQVSGQLHSALYVALASAHEGAGDLDKAAEAYGETIRMSRMGKTATGIAVVFLLGGVLWILGRLRKAEAACREALEYVEEQGMSGLPAAGILHVALAEVLVERNELQAAEEHLLQGMELGRRSGRLNAIHNAAHARMRLCLARHDERGAMAAVQEAIAALGEPKGSLTWGELLAFQATILLRQGALAEAVESIEEATRLANQDRGVAGQMVALAAHRVRLARAKPEQAIAQLAQSLTAAEESGRWGAAIEMRILRSLALAKQGHTREAEADLEHALTLAEPEGYVRVFLDEGEPMRLLLERMRAEGGGMKSYVEKLLSAFPPSNRIHPSSLFPHPSLAEPLTPRELEVLQLICAGDSNQAIADKLVITLSAVKKHTGNILGKLGVTSRAQAMVKAHELGLSP